MVRVEKRSSHALGISRLKQLNLDQFKAQGIFLLLEFRRICPRRILIWQKVPLAVSHGTLAASDVKK